MLHLMKRRFACVSARHSIVQRSALIQTGDSPFCEHLQTFSAGQRGMHSFSPLRSSGQSPFSEDGFADLPFAKRRGSNRNSQDSLSNRFNRHWPSISKKWRERKSTTSSSGPNVRSAPPSRSSSFQGSFVQESLANYLGPLHAATSPTTPITSRPESTTSAASVSAWHAFDNAFNASPPAITEDPIDREQLNSTPLLPPLLTDMRNQAEEVVQSPLQSPSVALYSAPTSIAGTPVSSPQARALPTPPLSAKPSFASLGLGRVNHANHTYKAREDNEVETFEEYWADQLGHSDYDINPKPYRPGRRDFASCQVLLENWKAARVEFIRHAADIREHYGPSSKVYKLTAEKWRGIDAQWRWNFEEASALAGVSSSDSSLRTLPEMQSAPDIPSLEYDPRNPDKFLNVGKADMVGPMIQQQSKVQQKPAKKAWFLKVLTDPLSLLPRQ